jgi:hypothetical protein
MYIYPEAGGFHSPRIMANGYSSAERVKPREKRALTRWAPRAATRSQFVHPAPDPHVRLGEERVEADRTVPPVGATCQVGLVCALCRPSKQKSSQAHNIPFFFFFFSFCFFEFFLQLSNLVFELRI